MTNRLIQLMRSQQHRPIHPTGQTIKAKKRTHAKARTRGNRNRRLITIDKWWTFGPIVQAPSFEVERQYHFTKGYRIRSV